MPKETGNWSGAWRTGTLSNYRVHLRASGDIVSLSLLLAIWASPITPQVSFFYSSSHIQLLYSTHQYSWCYECFVRVQRGPQSLLLSFSTAAWLWTAFLSWKKVYSVPSLLSKCSPRPFMQRSAPTCHYKTFDLLFSRNQGHSFSLKTLEKPCLFI